MAFPIFKTILFVATAGLVSLSAVYWYTVKHIRLPISSLLPATALFLPLLNAVALNYSTGSAVRDRRFRGNPKWNMQIGIVQFLVIIAETIVITLSAQNLDPEFLSCPLERQWQNFFSAKDATAIRTIQDTLGCCGLRSPVDRAYPFPRGKDGSPAICKETMHGDKSCFGPWRRQEQIASGIFMTVALLTFMSKLFVLAASRLNNSSLQSFVYGEFPNYQRKAGFIETPHENDENSDIVDATPRSVPGNGVRLRPDERTRLLENGSDQLPDESGVWDDEARGRPATPESTRRPTFL